MSANANRIRILIVEDHAFVRESLRHYLEAQPDMEVIADTEDGEETLRIVQEQVPNVVLLDLVLSRSKLTGLEVLKRVLSISPNTHVLVLSAYSDDDLAFPALQTGAIGYMLKNAYAHEVIEAVRDAATGHYYLDPLLAKRIVGYLVAERANGVVPKELQRLTAREQEVLQHILNGESNKAIAEALVISLATVKTHVSNILNKLGLKDRRDLGDWWKRQQPPPPRQP